MLWFLFKQENLYERFGAGFYRGIDYSMSWRSDEDWKKLMDSVCAMEPKSDEFSVKKWEKFLNSPRGVSNAIRYKG